MLEGPRSIMHNLFFCGHTLCISQVIKTFLLVSFLCFVLTAKAKKENKNIRKSFTTIPLYQLLVPFLKILRARKHRHCSKIRSGKQGQM